MKTYIVYDVNSDKHIIEALGFGIDGNTGALVFYDDAADRVMVAAVLRWATVAEFGFGGDGSN